MAAPEYKHFVEAVLGREPLSGQRPTPAMSHWSRLGCLSPKTARKTSCSATTKQDCLLPFDSSSHFKICPHHKPHFATFCCPHLIIKALWLNSLPRTRALRSQLLFHCTPPWSSRSRDASFAQIPFHRAQTPSSSRVSRMASSCLPPHQARVLSCSLVTKMRVPHSCSLHHRTSL